MNLKQKRLYKPNFWNSTCLLKIDATYIAISIISINIPIISNNQTYLLIFPSIFRALVVLACSGQIARKQTYLKLLQDDTHREHALLVNMSSLIKKPGRRPRSIKKILENPLVMDILIVKVIV